MRIGIRPKLMIGIGAPLAALLALSLAVSFDAQRDVAMTRTKNSLSQDAQTFASELDGRFQMLAQIGRSTAAFLDTHPALPEDEIYTMLRRNVEQSPLVYGSCVAFEPDAFQEGRRLFAPYVYKGVGTEPASRRDAYGLLKMDVADASDYTDPKWAWFNQPRRTLQAMWTEPFFDEDAGNGIMCTFVAPFFKDASRREFRGTVNIDVRLSDLQRPVNLDAAQLQQPDRNPLASPGGSMGPAGLYDIRGIFSRDGTIISWPEPEMIMHQTIFTFAENQECPDLARVGRRMLEGKIGVERVVWPDGPTPLLVSFAPIASTGWVYATSVEEARAMAPVYDELRRRALTAVAMIVVIIGVILAIGVWLTKPIETLASAVKNLDVGNLGALTPVAAGGQDEIGDLGRAFNTMVMQLRGQVAALTQETKARESVESELRIAREIQQSLLPRTFPPFPDRPEFDLYAYNGAARRVAGDFYDFFFLPDGRLAVVIADVCGKGVPAAMFMAVARTVVRNLAVSGRSPAALLDEANTILMADNTQGLFVTIIVAFYDPATGGVLYANGGHPRPYVLQCKPGPGPADCRPFGQVTGTIVGALPDQSWAQADESLAVGETMVMFTDGVPDARRPGGVLFGEHRLVELLQELAAEPVDALCKKIVQRLDEYAASDWPDDVTLLVLRRNS